MSLPRRAGLHAALATAQVASHLHGLATRIARWAFQDDSGDVGAADGVIWTVVPCHRCKGEGCQYEGDTCDRVDFVNVDRHEDVADALGREAGQ